MARYKSDNVDLLLPSFATKAREIIAAMKARGFEAVPFDTLRTKEEAARNLARGVGIADSIHCYGAACDCICADHGWDCAKQGCSFYRVLGREVEARNLVWGGRFRRRDMPHFQALTIRDQPAFRALPDATARDAFIRARLCK